MENIEVEIRKVGDGFHASIPGDSRSTTTEGKTKEEALGKLIIKFSATFGIIIEDK